ncbi:integral membrane GPR155 isoform X1 [Pelobates cultripes]|uniref:Integral membrane GPR155 isoform X1 n=1 Tax=Pelobates cultripes TaxID=61616 RepID=A0AAD1SMF9_PELCU|nr:integral membrane GPR155 isoform X1 [Pelobates cultripes]
MSAISGVVLKNLSYAVNMSLTVASQTNTTTGSPSMSINRLFPALLECFGIILCGYIAGRANVITPIQAKGLGNYVSRFALPALLFKNMVVLDFSNVNWSFLYGIMIAKATVFFLVCVLTLLVASPQSRFSKAGLFPIFATQSNDFALGYPIVDALYQTTYPEYLQYIYLAAPVSLMMLNPLGFVLCEIQRWRDNPTTNQSKIKILGLAFLRAFQNPIVFMVFIGIAFNFALGQKIPIFMENFLDGLASSFSGSALFYLGLSMVGQTSKLKKSSFVALLLLITAKLLAVPLICREMVELLDKSNSPVNHTSLSNYAFLYGVFPVAPGVAIFANQFNMEVEIVTSGMVISTFVSAPIMYVSAWLLAIPTMDPKPLMSALQNVSFDISIVGSLSLVWTLAVLLLSKKYKLLPHSLTGNLLLAQFIVCIGMVLWNFIIQERNVVGQILVFVILYSALYSTYLWTGLISLSLFLLKKREVGNLPVVFIALAGWGIPVLIVCIIVSVGERDVDCTDSAFFYGKFQIICTAVVLSCSILLSSISLLFMSRIGQDSNYQALNQSSQSSINRTPDTSEIKPDSPVLASTPTVSAERGFCACGQENGDLCNPMETANVLNINEPPSIEEAHECLSRCNSQRCILSQEEQQLHSVDPQTSRHVLLCLLLVVGLFANVSSCFWWLFNLEPGRLYVELQFFCAVFNFGQGFLSFAIFGLDKHLIILPCKKRLEFLWSSRESNVNTVETTLPEEIRMTCHQFVHYHKDLCVRNIVKERRCGAQMSPGVFWGSDLVTWLVQVGLAPDRGEAVKYGERLLKGGVIQHITDEYEFRDENLYYRMVKKRRVPARSN